MATSQIKKYGAVASDNEDDAKSDSSTDSFKPYVPLKDRRRQLAEKYVKKRVISQAEMLADEDEEEAVGSGKEGDGATTATTTTTTTTGTDGDGGNTRKKKKGDDASRTRESLFVQYTKAMQDKAHVPVDEEEQLKEKEQEILESIKPTQKLMSAAELANDIKYTKALHTSWKAPRWALNAPSIRHDRLRSKYMIDVEGEQIPPPLETFTDMKLHPAVVKCLAQRGIKKPSPIQIQGLPVALSGRDMIAIAFTGSGKTIVFVLPLLHACMEQEIASPFGPGEGPYALLLCPSRELARQTHDVLRAYADAMADSGLPRLRSVLLVGGVDMRDQGEALRGGVHVVVGTPGRTIDLLSRNRFNLDVCRYLVLDEADRMVDMGFEEDMRTLISFFPGQRQTLLFSATMPPAIREFARSALVDPVTINVCRAGAASLDVVQDIVLVKSEARMAMILECLQKTPPPVLIFAEKKADVDAVHEYLLTKGVEAAAIHGSKTQDERDHAVDAFRRGRKDVLVATDVASKGLDFSGVQHVINFDMPAEIENYVHRIGRTGRGGRTGLATTFIDRTVPTPTLLDLKHLLIEARQRVPQFLSTVGNEAEQFLDLGGTRGCALCGGPGHRVADCPKREALAQKQISAIGRSDFLNHGHGGDY